MLQQSTTNELSFSATGGTSPFALGRPIAFSSEVDTGSREENASKQKIRASVLIQSEPKRL
jgi:hypothetical protein